MSEETVTKWLEEMVSKGADFDSCSFRIRRFMQLFGDKSDRYQTLRHLKDRDGEALVMPDDIGYVCGYFMGVTDVDFAGRVEKAHYCITFLGVNSDGRFERHKHITKDVDDGQD